MEVRFFGTGLVEPDDPNKVTLAKKEEDPSEERRKELEAAGFTAAAKQLAASQEDPWAEIKQLSEPMDFKNLAAYRHWFRAGHYELDTYAGELPAKLPRRVIEFNGVKPALKLKVWVAKSGEALLVGKLPKQPEREPQRFIIAQWHPQGNCTSLETIRQHHRRFVRRIVIGGGALLVAIITILAVLAVNVQLPAASHESSSSRESDNDWFPFPFPFLFLALAPSLYMMTLSSSRRRANAANSGSADNSATPEDVAPAEPSSTGHTAQITDEVPTSTTRSRANSLKKDDQQE